MELQQEQDLYKVKMELQQEQDLYKLGESKEQGKRGKIVLGEEEKSRKEESH